MSLELRPLRAAEFEDWIAGWSAWYAHDLEVHGGLRPAAAREKADRDMASRSSPRASSRTGNVLLAIEDAGAASA